MREQMVLAILIIACTFGAVTELQILAILFRSSADGTAVMGIADSGYLHPLMISFPAMYLLW